MKILRRKAKDDNVRQAGETNADTDFLSINANDPDPRMVSLGVPERPAVHGYVPGQPAPMFPIAPPEEEYATDLEKARLQITAVKGAIAELERLLQKYGL